MRNVGSAEGRFALVVLAVLGGLFVLAGAAEVRRRLVWLGVGVLALALLPVALAATAVGRLSARAA